MRIQFKEQAVTSAQALELGGLNFGVSKVPLQSTAGGIVLPDAYATWRTDKIGSADGYLGVVGNSYKVIQNNDSLSFFDSILSREEMSFTEAGYKGNGERVWLKAKMPDTMNINGNDVIEEYIVLSNSHDGSSTLSIKFVALRLVCTNGMTAFVDSGRQGLNIRHCSNAKDKIQEAYKILGLAKSTFKKWEENISRLSNIQIKPQDLDVYYNRVLGVKVLEDASTRVLNTKDVLNDLFQNGMGAELSGGSVWNAINSVTEYVDHHKTYKNGHDDYAKLFGSGDILKTKSYTVAEEMFLQPA